MEAGVISEHGGNGQGADAVERRLVGEPVITARLEDSEQTIAATSAKSIRVEKQRFARKANKLF